MKRATLILRPQVASGLRQPETSGPQEAAGLRGGDGMVGCPEVPLP
jgi:hypothetical protein